VHVARTGKNRNIYRAQVKKLEGERKLRRLRLEDNVKMDFFFIRYGAPNTHNELTYGHTTERS